MGNGTRNFLFHSRQFRQLCIPSSQTGAGPSCQSSAEQTSDWIICFSFLLTMSGNTASGEPRTENPYSLPSPAPPRAMMRDDDPSAVEPARRRLAPKSRLRIFSSLPNLSSCYKFKRSKRQPADAEFEANSPNQSVGELPPLEQTNDNTTIITLDNSSIPNIRNNKDEYRWAVVYENQRGYIRRHPFMCG
jgi:hypothetical protein